MRLASATKDQNAGVKALSEGDYSTARDIFESGMRAAPTVDGYINLSKAYSGLNDPAARLNAIDNALRIDPRNISALIAKGDHYDDIQQVKAAGPFYQAAISAANEVNLLPDALRQDVYRAQRKCEEYFHHYETFLRQNLSNSIQETDSATNGAFSRSIDLIFNKRQVFHQQPTQYFFPELPAIQFYDTRQFGWIDALNAQTAEITEELQRVINDKETFSPYVQNRADTPYTDNHGMMNNADWSAFYLWKDGAPVEENIAKCPKTMKAMEALPLAQIPGASPSILFSLLRGGSSIPPHTGRINTRLICHLPLIVPEGCGFRVGNETRQWQAGETWIFDDTINHEAWNKSRENRYVLIFDIEQPALSPEDHAAVAALFEAIQAYQ